MLLPEEEERTRAVVEVDIVSLFFDLESNPVLQVFCAVDISRVSIRSAARFHSSVHFSHPSIFGVVV